jgi:tRNA-2-methylthio-N6-dimethylallyladenosine synthase
MKSYHLITYGCQMNLSDSERIAAVMKKMKLKPTAKNAADLIIFNLCSVRQKSVDKVWGMVGNLSRTTPHLRGSRGISKNKKPLLIVTGCILPVDKKKFIKKVDLVLDIKDLNEWPEIITRYSLSVTHYKKETTSNYFSISPNYNSKFQAYVPIMTGCDNFCSYCAVPYVRGHEVSRPAAEIIKEVNKLVVQGYKFITLLGQNVNSYQDKVNSKFQIPASSAGRLNPKKILNSKFKIQNSIVNFPALLKLIDSIPGDYWLSFITSHPKDMSNELIGCFKNCQHLIPYLHLPLQAGSDKILKAMNRKYSAKHYLNLISKIRRSIRNISISTDVIVGFPGETQKDFQETVKLMKLIKFDMAYLAEYSPRPNTAAAKMKDGISSTEKHRRYQTLNKILKKTALENNKKMIGQITEVLIERIVETDLDLSVYGQTRNFKNIKIICHPDESRDPEKQLLNSLPRQQVGGSGAGIINNLIGNFIKVKVTKANPWSLEGKMIK